MKREIKFRAWDKVNSLFHFPKLWDKSMPENWDHWYELQQFTGLKDKNCVEIYEGDILSKTAYDGDNEYILITKVVFADSCFCLEKISGSPKQEIGTLMSFPNNMPIIIGNIYQNPELL